MVESLATLSPAVIWKENTPSELAKEISKLYVEGSTQFLLVAYSRT